MPFILLPLSPVIRASRLFFYFFIFIIITSITGLYNIYVTSCFLFFTVSVHYKFYAPKTLSASTVQSDMQKAGA